MRLGFRTVLMGAAAAALLAVDVAEAQQVSRGETVTSRPRPELDPLGIRAGSFLFFPGIKVDGYYDDNLFATETNKVDDFVTVARPGLSIESDWENHSLTLAGEGAFGFYEHNPDENYQDFNANLDGRFDITRDIAAYAGASFVRGHEERGSPDDVGGQEPTIVEQLGGYLQYDHVFGRFNATVDLDYLDVNYDDVPAANGVEINNDDRDREESSFALRLGYEIVPEYEAFIRGRANTRQYRQERDDNGFLRDSYGWEANAGVDLDLGGIVFGDVFVGYADQTYYDDDLLPDIGGITFGGSIDWNITTLTTLNGSIVRTIEETTIANGSGYFSTNASIGADHELLRNLLLNLRLSATQNDYEFNTGIERTDYIYQGVVGAKYLLNRYFYASLNYRYTQREASDNRAGVDPDYRNNVVTIRLEAQM